jgi:hypothetical protein
MSGQHIGCSCSLDATCTLARPHTLTQLFLCHDLPLLLLPTTPTNSTSRPTPGPTKGLFTSTNPEMRRVVPDDVAGRVKVKVVYTVLEAQYQSALTAAVQAINKTNKTVRGCVLGVLGCGEGRCWRRVQAGALSGAVGVRVSPGLDGSGVTCSSCCA